MIETALPEWVGPYRVVRLLGHGGMGTVYLADEEQPIRRRVAVKVLREGLVNPRAVARFQVERETLSMMTHPGIAHVYSAGVTEAGQPWVSMEYVQGDPITQYCRNRGLDLEARVQLMIDVSAAVAHAHRKSVIHRDLKPTNVLVTEVDGAPVPKVIDFGLARHLGDAAGGDAGLTQAGSLVGTPAYMSPEQAAGRNESMDTRTDVYGLGVLLYEILTGEAPHGAAPAEEAPFLEILDQVLREDPQLPSARVNTTDASNLSVLLGRPWEPNLLSRRIKGDLDRVVMRSLEKDPERRYASADDLAEDLGRYLRHEPVEAVSPSLGYRLRKFVARNALAVGAVAAVFLALVAGLIASLVLYDDAREARYLAEANATRAHDVAHAANREGARHQLAYQYLVSHLRPPDGVDPSKALYVEALDNAARHLDQGVSRSAAAVVHTLLGGLYEGVGRTGTSIQQLRAGLAAVREAHGAVHPFMRDVLIRLLETLLKVKRPREALAVGREALQVEATLASGVARSPDAKDTVLILMAQAHLAVGDFAEAGRLAEEVLRRALGRGAGPTDSLTMDCVNVHVDALIGDERYADAAAAVDAYYDHMETAQGRDGGAVEAHDLWLGANTLLRMGRSLHEAGQYATARKACELSLPWLRAAIGREPDSELYRGDVINALSGVGRAARRLGDMDAALPALREAEKLMRERVQAGHASQGNLRWQVNQLRGTELIAGVREPSTPYDHLLLASELDADQRFGEAVPHWRHAIADEVMRERWGTRMLRQGAQSAAKAAATEAGPSKAELQAQALAWLRMEMEVRREAWRTGKDVRLTPDAWVRAVRADEMISKLPGIESLLREASASEMPERDG